MLRIAGHAALPAALRGGVIALGNFDGFHLGHQSVVGRAIERARAEGRPALVGTFDPHPARHFRPDLPPMALTTIPQRLDLFEAAGVEGAVVWTFDHALAGMTAHEFVEHELVGRLHAHGVVTGWDFTFGKGRGGSPPILGNLGAEFGFWAETVSAVGGETAPVSSTRVRQALMAARPDEAAVLLGRPFAVRGAVIHGDKRGRALGFPTANMMLGDYVRPAYGVYAVRVRLPDGSVRDGVANLGVRPMFEPPVELLETWILDWEGDLYGAEIEVALVAFIRGEAKFEGVEALTAQVRADAARARELLAAAAAR